MNMEAGDNQETVFWVNRFSERSVRNILGSLRILKPSKDGAFTVISIDEIDAVQDDELRESLTRQLQDKREGAWTIELPVAHMPARKFSHSYDILTQSSSERIHERIDSTQRS